jgi:hypothetical protein
MSKKIPIILLIQLIMLACSMPIADIVDNPLTQPTAEGFNQEIEQINSEIDDNFDGFQTYHVKPFPGSNNTTECKPGFEIGDQWTKNSIMRFDNNDDWEHSQITIESGKNNFLTYNIVVKEKPNTFCRLNEQSLVECVYLDIDGYTVRVFNDPPYNQSFLPYLLETPKTCYSLLFEKYEEDLSQVAEESEFTTVALPPDIVEISLWGPIPAMPVTSQSTGQYYPNGGHDALWYFEPDNIENWSIAFKLDTTEGTITGTFSGTALYQEEDTLYSISGNADINGSIPLTKYSFEYAEGAGTISAPFEIIFAGNVHEPNQFAATENGTVLDFLAYQDVEFRIVVEGTLKIISPTNTTTSDMEFEVSDCQNSEFYSPNEGAQLSKCSIRLVWNDVSFK